MRANTVVALKDDVDPQLGRSDALSAQTHRPTQWLLRITMPGDRR